jgi:Sortase domain
MGAGRPLPGTEPLDGAVPRQGSSAPHSRLPLAVALALLGLFATAVGVGQLVHPELPDLLSLFGGDAAAAGATAPIRLTIPDLHVRAPVIQVGRADDGSIAVPVSDPVRAAGWYDEGPRPGESGTAVMVGHVDTADQPAVFSQLANLSPGARIEVTRRDRHVAAFTVDSVGRYPKTSFPAGRIFGPSPEPRLVLVTCGGRWVGGTVGYADNVIVFATLTR